MGGGGGGGLQGWLVGGWGKGGGSVVFLFPFPALPRALPRLGTGLDAGGCRGVTTCKSYCSMPLVNGRL